MDKARKFVIGDIHGNYAGLKEVLYKAKFDYDKDTLIVLGDICDGYPFVKSCVDLLLTIKNRVIVMGNHDEWAFEWMKSDDHSSPANKPNYWLTQGGLATIESYTTAEGETLIPASHIEFFETALPYYEMNDYAGRLLLFVHGGIKAGTYAKDNSKDMLLWDRSLVELSVRTALEGSDFNVKPYDKIFVGHTPTLLYRDKTMDATYPISIYGLTLCDTGAGWGGKLSLLEMPNSIKRGAIYQSRTTRELYPNIIGR